MSSLFDRMMGRGGKSSSEQAKDRLQFVLVHDRINLPPEKLTQMKEEILAVISRYVSVDRENVEIALEQRDRAQSKLVAEIPFVGKKPPADDDGESAEAESDSNSSGTSPAAGKSDASSSGESATEPAP